MNGVRCGPPMSALSDGDRMVTDDREKADLFAKQFAKVSCSLNYSDEFREHKLDVETNRPELFANDAPVTAMTEKLNVDFSIGELERAIGQTRRGTATGEDRVAADFLAHLPTVAKNVVVRLFNKVWTEGKLPCVWKRAIVIPILKAGKDGRAAESYRPIALTSALCKLMERLVANRLTWYLETHGLLCNVQSGFRRHRSTIDPIARLHDQIVRQIGNGGFVLAVFVDMEKAYDMMWRKGLMLKLKQFGINGRMFDWIADFLEGRSIRVRVGTSLSRDTVLENGTPQGAMISPSAFIAMINDLPSYVHDADTSLFADDTMLQVHGKSVKLLVTKMQRALDSLQGWCDQWGFKISTSKTVAVLFTHHLTDECAVNLSLNGQPLAVEKSAKFLGVVFDRRLTWREHIEYVRAKCQKRLNLLRSLSGTTWGADRQSMLTVYRALIRSIVDYGAIVYDSASETMLQSVASIQYQALKLACGAMVGTSAAALQVECGEWPLALRRLAQQIKFAAKVKATAGHMANDIFAEHWTSYYGKFSNRCRPLAAKVENYFRTHDKKFRGPELGHVPPWLVRSPRTDIELAGEVSKHDAPGMLAALARNKIAEYGDCFQIYTDASRLSNGVVGVGCLIAASSENEDIEHSARISDGSTVYTAELYAVSLALVYVKQLAARSERRRFAIFSDSLSVVTAFRSGKSKGRPNLLREAMETLHGTDSDVTLIWLPSHIGIQGNEKADRLANLGANRPEPDHEIDFELGEAYAEVDRYVMEMWQNHWDNEPTGSFYRRLVPKVGGTSRMLFSTRQYETAATRLRFGKCRLNAYLHQIGLHETGHCDRCNVPETVEHFLFDCTGEVTELVRDACRDRGIDATVEAVLGNQSALLSIVRASGSRL